MKNSLDVHNRELQSALEIAAFRVSDRAGTAQDFEFDTENENVSARNSSRLLILLPNSRLKDPD